MLETINKLLKFLMKMERGTHKKKLKEWKKKLLLSLVIYVAEPENKLSKVIYDTRTVLLQVKMKISWNSLVLCVRLLSMLGVLTYIYARIIDTELNIFLSCSLTKPKEFANISDHKFIVNGFIECIISETSKIMVLIVG